MKQKAHVLTPVQEQELRNYYLALKKAGMPIKEAKRKVWCVKQVFLQYGS